MIEALIDALLAGWRWLLPFTVIPEYGCGVRLRLGLNPVALGPGLHWIIPWGVDAVLTDNAVIATSTLSPQSLTTRDSVDVVLSVILTWKIRDAVKLLVYTEGRESVLSDVACGLVTSAVSDADWSELTTEDFRAELLKSVRKRAFRYGIEVEGVAFHSLARCQSIRLLTDHALTTEEA